MVKKIENRNIDVTKARGELEEDLLEYVYRTWRQGRQITSKEYAREVNITGYEAAGLVRSLVKKGFLCEPENGHLELTDKGKLEGMECLARHEKLTQFFHMVSGMDQQRAQEDACRVEHYISPEGLKGIGMLCEKCHTEMIAMNEDNVGEVICPKCGWNIVATKINDIMLDTKMYQLYALKNENINMSQIRILSKISGENFICIKRNVTKNKMLIMNARAAKIKDALKMLKKEKIEFEVVPDFKY